MHLHVNVNVLSIPTRITLLANDRNINVSSTSVKFYRQIVMQLVFWKSFICKLDYWISCLMPLGYTMNGTDMQIKALKVLTAWGLLVGWRSRENMKGNNNCS